MHKIKLSIFSLMIATVLLFCGCEIKEDYKFAQPVSSIVSIEIVYISREGLSQTHELGNPTVNSKLNPKDWNAFLYDFQKLQCGSYWNDPPQCISEEAIQICYENGKIEMISANSSGTCIKVEDGYESDDFNWYYFDRDEFVELWNQYSNR